MVVQSGVAPHFPAETRDEQKARDLRVPIGLLSVRYSPCKLLSKTFVIDVDASNNGERGVSTSVFHGLDERVSQYPELELQQTGRSGCCHNKRHSLACFEPESWLLANGDLEELGKETTAQLEEEE